MPPKPDESVLAKIVSVTGGTKVANTAQVGTLGVLLWLGWSAKDIYGQIMDEAQRTREEIATLGERLNAMESALGSLANNAKAIERLDRDRDLVEQRIEALSKKLGEVESCARDRKRCP